MEQLRDDDSEPEDQEVLHYRVGYASEKVKQQKEAPRNDNIATYIRAKNIQEKFYGRNIFHY